MAMVYSEVLDLKKMVYNECLNLMEMVYNEILHLKKMVYNKGCLDLIKIVYLEFYFDLMEMVYNEGLDLMKILSDERGKRTSQHFCIFFSLIYIFCIFSFPLSAFFLFSINVCFYNVNKVEAEVNKNLFMRDWLWLSNIKEHILTYNITYLGTWDTVLNKDVLSDEWHDLPQN